MNRVSKIEQDHADILSGKILVAAITPLESAEQIEPYQKKGFFIDPDWVYQQVHLYLIFLNPLTEKIDATTSYNSPTDPPYLIFRGPNDPIGLYPDDEVEQSDYHNPAHLRDIKAVIDHEKRAMHKTLTHTIDGLDRMKLAQSLEYFRRLTKEQIAKNNLPLYGAKALGSERGKAVDCQNATRWVFQRAFPHEKLPTPEGTFITWLNAG